MIVEAGWSNFKYEYPNDRAATPEEFKNIMEQLKNNRNGFEESWHGDMDGLMCRVLTDLGYGEGISIFYDTPKWYS